MLKPLDVIVALKLAIKQRDYIQSDLAYDLDLSVSQVNRAIKQCLESNLLLDKKNLKVNKTALVEFLIHGVKYAFPGKMGSIKRGMLTAHSAPPLSQHINSHNEAIVWPDPEGKSRGESLKPLYRNVPFAARKDPDLYEALALLDAVRIGRVRERELATDLLRQKIQD